MAEKLLCNRDFLGHTCIHHHHLSINSIRPILGCLLLSVIYVSVFYFKVIIHVSYLCILMLC